MITILNICFIIIFLACAWLTMHAMAYVIDISENGTAAFCCLPAVICSVS